MDERVLEKLSIHQIQNLSPSRISELIGKDMDKDEIEELKRLASQVYEVSTRSPVWVT